MRGLLKVAHAPPCPAVHAPLGALLWRECAHAPLVCSARVRGLPPPAAARCAHSRGDPPRTCCPRVRRSERFRHNRVWSISDDNIRSVNTIVQVGFLLD